MPGPHDLAAQLRCIYKGAPKLCALLKIATRRIEFDNDKLAIFAALPANQILVHAVMKAMGWDSVLYTGTMDEEARAVAINDFNWNPNKARVLVMNYKVGAVGLNIQYSCRLVIHMDTPINAAVMEQAIGRFDRHGQAFDVESIEIILDGSVQDYLDRHLTKKSKATYIAQLTNTIFATVYDSDRGEDTTVDLIYKVDSRYLFKEQLQQQAPELVDVLEPIRVTELVDLF
jgi:superfamily II DNA helicase RecQ